MQRSVVTPKREILDTHTPLPVLKTPRSAKNSVQLEAPAVLRFTQRLSFYDTPPPPTAELPLESFEEWALDRISVLDELDRHFSRPKAEKEREMRVALNKFLPLTRGPVNPLTQRERFKDTMSHFILRLAFCQKPEDRQRFVRLESALFRMRFETSPPEECTRFIESLNLVWPKLSTEELSELEPLLRFNNPNSAAPLEPHYKVPMEEAMDLVRQRRVVLKAGFAFVPESQQASMLVREFSKRLNASLDKLSKYRLRFKNDPRIEPVLQLANSGFSKYQFKADPTKMQEKVDIRTLESMDKENYLPLCASMLQHSLKKNRHPLHQERLQHMRFLLNIGMSSEEVVRLYRMYYDDAKKLKQIEYSIEHMAGMKGNRKKISPSSCTSIYKDGQTATSNQVHGCPFQRLSMDKLELLLREHGINDEEGITEIKRHCETKQIHLACSKTYELTHPNDKTKYEHTISSPIQYFERAVTHAKASK